jgi:hypothetical protein
VTVTHFAGGDPAAPALKVVGAAGQTQQFWVENKLLTQALYTDERRNIRVRMFFDAVGDLVRVQDERSGAFLQFEYENERTTTVLVHDGTGRFLAGHEIYRNFGSTYYSAPIIGTPASAPQLRANLAGATPAAELVAWPDELRVRGEVTPVPKAIMDYVQTTPPASPQVAGPSPAIAVGAELLLLAHQSTGGTRAARGLIRGLHGAILVFAGTQVGALTAGTAAAVAAPLLAVVAVAAGTYLIAQGLDTTRTGTLELYEEAHAGFVQGKAPVEIVAELGQRIVMNVRMAVTRPITRVIENAVRELTTLRQDVAALVKPGPLPPQAGSLEGRVYDANGKQDLVTGEVTAAGKITLKNDGIARPIQIDADVTTTGQVSGTFNGELGSGTVEGAVEEVPTTCPSPQVLMDERRCGPPPVVTCDPPATIQSGVCVAPPVIGCAPPFVMMNGMCVQGPTTCTPPQVLENGMCVTPTVETSITYVLARQDVSGFKLYSTRNNPTLTEEGALAMARASGPGTWATKLVSRQPGWGSMFCVAPTGGANPAYFTAEGKASESEAITDAKNQAIASTTPQTNPIRYTFICGTWQNR